MSFVEGLSTASVDVADPTFAICVTAMILLVVGLFALPALAAALSLLRTEGLARFVSHLLRRSQR
ncbi:MAG: hypothetical protein JWM26_4557 [Betaproteobacteria bacterium]|jgi:hypothetical protein|nr:hypothetical protein [Betaproteobacteria bacterium]